MKPLISALLCATMAAAQMMAATQPVLASTTLGSAVPETVLASPSDQSHKAAAPADTIAFLETIRAGEPLFSSDFSDESGAWPVRSDDEIALTYEDEAYHMEVLDADTGDFSSAGVSVSDFYMEVDATQIAGPPDAWFGLFFRNEADDYGYVYTVNGDGAYQLLWVQEDNEPLTLIEETLTADLNTGHGTTNLLGVLADGQTLTLLVNDTVLAEVEHDGSGAGDIAFVAFTQEEPGLEVAFDNLRVWDITGGAASAAETPVTATPDVATPGPTPEPTPESAPPPEVLPESTGLPIDPSFDTLALLSAIQQEEPQFEESFLRDRGRWHTGSTDDAERFYADKEYHIAVTGTDRTEWTTAGIETGDFIAEVMARQDDMTPGSYVGLLFRYVDEGNLYAFLVNDEGEYLLQKLVDGVADILIPWQSSELIDNVAAENLLGIAAYGPKILLMANGHPLAYVVDDSLAAGDIALVAGTVSGDGMEAAFDDLIVWDAAPVRQYLDHLEEPSSTAIEEPAPALIDPAVLDAIYAEEPVLSESFTRNRDGWSTDATEFSSRYYEDRAYHIHLLQPSTVSWTTAQLSLSDLMAEVNATHIAGPLTGEAGLLFRFQDGDNFYRFAVTGDGQFTLDKKVSGVWETIAGPAHADALETGEGSSNTLSVFARGSTIAVLANGEVLATADDATFAGGDVALVAGTYADPGAIYAFDDLEVWDLAALADRLPAVDVAPEPDRGPAAFDLAVLDTIRLDEPVVNESFTRDRGAWETPTTDGYAFFFQDRAYHIREDSPLTVNWSAANLDLEDLLMEADVTFVSRPEDSGAGFVFRTPDADNAYLFTVRANGEWLLEKKVDGDWQTVIPATQSGAIATGEGATNRLGVYANGPLLAMLVNGSLLATVEDSSLSHGDVALAILTGEDAGAEAAFDDLQIWDLGPLADQLPQASAAAEPPAPETPAPEPTAQPATEVPPSPEVTPEPSPDAVEDDSTLATIERIRSVDPTYSIGSEDDEGLLQDMEDVHGETWWFDWDFAFRDGAYHFNNWTPGVTSAALTEIWADDFYMEVDTELVTDDPTWSPYGVLFRWNGDWYDGYGYLFEIDGAGSFHLLDEFADEIASSEASAAINTGEGSHNRLGILANGETIVLLANDTVLAEVQDDLYSEGYIGLYVYLPLSADDEVDLAFDNVNVWLLE